MIVSRQAIEFVFILASLGLTAVAIVAAVIVYGFIVLVGMMVRRQINRGTW